MNSFKKITNGQPVSSLVESIRVGVDERFVASDPLDVDFIPSLNSLNPLSPPKVSSQILKNIIKKFLISKL